MKNMAGDNSLDNIEKAWQWASTQVYRFGADIAAASG